MTTGKAYISNTYMYNNSTEQETLYTDSSATLTAWSKYTNGYRYRFELSNTYLIAKKRVELNNLFIFFTNGYSGGESVFAVGSYLPISGQVQIGQYNDCGKYNPSRRMYYSEPITMSDFVTFDTSSAWATNPPYVSIAIYDIIPEAKNLYPTEFVSANLETTFKWEFYADTPTDGTPLEQQSAKIQWKPSSNGTVTEITVSGSAQEYTFPAGTFPAESSFIWRIMVTSDDDVDSAWTNWQTVSTDEPVGAVENIVPSGMLVDGEVDNQFTWNYTSGYGLPPSGYEIQQAERGSTAWSTIASADNTPDCYAIIPANTLLSGNVQIRIRAFNSLGDASEWTTVEITVRDSPPPPSVYQIDSNTDKPIIYWSSGEQAAFDLKIKNASGTEIYSVYQSGNAKNHKLAIRIDDGTYTAYVAIVNNYSLRSEYATRQFTVTTGKPDKPTITAQAVDDYAVLSFAGTTENTVLIRDGVAIADVSGEYEYRDYTAPRDAVYVLRSLAENSFCDSDPAECHIKCKYSTIAPVSLPEHRVKLIVRANEQPDRNVTIGTEYALLTFAGRKLPVAEIGEHVSKTKSLSFSIFSEDDLQNLLKMNGGIVVWRDKNEKIAAIMTDFEYIRYRKYIDIAFILSEISSPEGIAYE